jgi:hypothetical protein
MDLNRVTEKMADPFEPLTLSGVIDDLDRRGFAEHFALCHDRLCVLGGPRSFAAHEIAIVEVHRFEGVSDPDDMAIVYALETHSGVRGTLTDAYGVYADASIGHFVDGIAMRRPTRHRSGVAGTLNTAGRRVA